MASGQLRQPGVDPSSPQSDPFDSSDPSSRQPADDDDEAEFQRFFGDEPASDVNEEDGHQKSDPDAPADAQADEDPGEKDFWTFNGEALTCHHRVPRSTLFVPSDPSSPIPTKYLDVMRTTYTDLDTKEEKRMEDYWNVQGEKALSDFWVGKTVFYILRTPPEPGFT